MTAIGIDVGGTSIRIGRVDGAPVVNEPTATRGGTDLVTRLQALLTPMLDAPGKVTTIGIGVPGHVDAGAGTVRHAVNIGIADEAFPLGATLAELLGIPVLVDNDARLAADGARHLLRARRPALSSLAYVNLGTGVSAGFVLDGRVHRGAHAVAGEIGHAPLGDPAVRCSCGLMGCLEAIAGGRALAARTGTDVTELFAADSADPGQARRVAEAIARALYLLATTLDPEVFVLGGGIAHDAHPWVQAAVTELTTGSPVAAAVLSGEIVTLPAGAHPGVVGAALLAGRDHPPAEPSQPPVDAGTRQGDTP